MTIAESSLHPAQAVEAELQYAVNTGVKPVRESTEPGELVRETGSYEMRKVAIRNGRLSAERFALDVQGFEFVLCPTAVENFFDAAEVRGRYYAEATALIQRVSGARRVVIFDHTIRTGDDGKRVEKLLREPVKSIHNDYSEWSGPQRVRDLLPDEADDLLARRFAIVQTWRPINHPVARDPLAICDARSLAPSDFIAAERRHPGRVGEIYQFTYNPAHRWYYFPVMRPEEVLVFKVYDSMKDGRARFSAHTAFEDPTSPADAPARESIEIRAFAFF